MVRGNHQYIFLLKQRQHSRQCRVKFRQRPGIAFNVVPVPIEHIIVHQIDKAQPFKIPGKVLLCPLDAFCISLGIYIRSDSLPGKNIPDLPHANHFLPGFLDGVKDGRGRGRKGIIMPSGRSLVVSPCAIKGPGNHPSYAVPAGKKPPCHFTVLIKGFHRHHILMGGHLEHAVRRGVDNQIPCPYMLFPIVFDHFCSRIRAVTENAPSCHLAKSLCNFRRKPLRVNRQRIGGYDPCNLPVAYGSILPPGSFPHSPVKRTGVCCALPPVDPVNIE